MFNSFHYFSCSCFTGATPKRYSPLQRVRRLLWWLFQANLLSRAELFTARGFGKRGGMSEEVGSGGSYEYYNYKIVQLLLLLVGHCSFFVPFLFSFSSLIAVSSFPKRLLQESQSCRLRSVTAKLPVFPLVLDAWTPWGKTS